ncbi:hypothetical protein C5167_030713 [Papaver somniferum]|nr:hypothetical protein C5167_030713 [Papaver somniferum]
MWFEWSEIFGYHNFAMEEVNTKDLDDSFWDRPSLGEDVWTLRAKEPWKRFNDHYLKITATEPIAVREGRI